MARDDMRYEIRESKSHNRNRQEENNLSFQQDTIDDFKKFRERKTGKRITIDFGDPEQE